MDEAIPKIELERSVVVELERSVVVVGGGQVSNLASSLFLYSPKCVVEVFSEVRPAFGVISWA
jgi:hypothetical protein